MINFDNLTKLHVGQLEHKHQFVITYEDNEGNDIYAFQSYKTLIAIAVQDLGGHNTLLVNWQKWDISKTTLKHLKIFVNRYSHLTYESKAQFIALIKSGQVQLF